MSKQSRPTPDPKTLSSQRICAATGTPAHRCDCSRRGHLAALACPGQSVCAPGACGRAVHRVGWTGSPPAASEAKVGEPLTVQFGSLDTPYHTDGGGKHQFA